MRGRRAVGAAPLVVSGLGVALFTAAVVHHVDEVVALSGSVGPLLAFVLDGVPALALVYAGVVLQRSDSENRDQWLVCRWTLAGAVVFVAVMGATFLIRVAEGRVVAEPEFPLLIAAEVGALAGFTAGYQTARVERAATRARTVSDALAFVNGLLRHDLRNDLNVIQGHATALAAGEDEGSDDAAVIEEEAERAFDRIETSGAIAETLLGDSDLEPVDLSEVVAEMADGVADVHGVEVETELPSTAVVHANAGLRSVVDNLLENAAEHNDADDPRIQANVDLDDDVVRLTVSDNGPGVPEEVRAAIERSRGSTSAGGGLSVVQTLVEGYGGRLRVRDAQPRGSAFVVELPTPDASRSRPVSPGGE